MRRTNCIVSILLKDADSTLFCLRISAGTKHTIVMMHTGTTEDLSSAIDRQSVLRIPFQKTDTKVLFYYILTKRCAQCIKIRICTVPEFCIRDLHVKNRRMSFIFHLFCENNFFSIEDFYFHFTCTGGLDLHFDHGRCIAHGTDLDSIDRDIFFCSGPEPDRTIDSRAGIPAAVWLIRIPCDHTNLVLRFVF